MLGMRLQFLYRPVKAVCVICMSSCLRSRIAGSRFASSMVVYGSPVFSFVGSMLHRYSKVIEEHEGALRSRPLPSCPTFSWVKPNLVNSTTPMGLFPGEVKVRWVMKRLSDGWLHEFSVALECSQTGYTLLSFFFMPCSKYFHQYTFIFFALLFSPIHCLFSTLWLDLI